MNEIIENEAAMLTFATQLAKTISAPYVIYLQGDLGAGKTTLTRGLLTAWGHQGVVKSPTFTLVEPYQLEKCSVYHFDLYRVNDPEELELIGIRDYFAGNAICIIEWPEKAQSLLPKPDLIITIEIDAEQRKISML